MLNQGSKHLEVIEEIEEGTGTVAPERESEVVRDPTEIQKNQVGIIGIEEELKEDNEKPKEDGDAIEKENDVEFDFKRKQDGEKLKKIMQNGIRASRFTRLTLS
jgi:hypothetical protein